MSLTFSHTHQQGNGTTEVVAVLFAIIDERPAVLTVDAGKLAQRSIDAATSPRQYGRVEEQTDKMLDIERLTLLSIPIAGSGWSCHHLCQLFRIIQKCDCQPGRQLLMAHHQLQIVTRGLFAEHYHSKLGEDNRVQWRCWYGFFPLGRSTESSLTPSCKSLSSN